MFLLRELIPKYKCVCFEFLMKVVVALFRMNVFEILNGTKNSGSFQMFYDKRFHSA